MNAAGRALALRQCLFSRSQLHAAKSRSTCGLQQRPQLCRAASSGGGGDDGGGKQELAPPDVRELARMAHIGLTDEEVAEWGPQIARVVEWFGQLNEIDVDGIPPAVRSSPIDGNMLRPDEVVRVEGQADYLLNQMPGIEGRFVRDTIRSGNGGAGTEPMAAAASPGGLAQLHHELHALLPELLQVQQFLSSSLALNEQTEVAPLLRQRLHQCQAAAQLLQAPPDATADAGQVAAHEKALLDARPFILDCVATLREHQARMREVPSMGTTERAWQRHGVVLAQPPAAAQLTHAAQPPPAALAAQAAAAGRMQQQPQQPAPLGMVLLQQQQQQEQEQQRLAALQQQRQQQLAALHQHQHQQAHQQAHQQQGAVPHPWTATPGVHSPHGLHAGGGGGDAAVPPPLCASVEMLPVLRSSIGGGEGLLPTLSQLLQEPSSMVMTLSLQEDQRMWPAGSLGAAVGGDASLLQLPPVPPPLPPAEGGAATAVAAATAAAAQQQASQQQPAAQEQQGQQLHGMQLSSLGLQDSSMRLLEQLLAAPFEAGRHWMAAWGVNPPTPAAHSEPPAAAGLHAQRQQQPQQQPQHQPQQQQHQPQQPAWAAAAVGSHQQPFASSAAQAAELAAAAPVQLPLPAGSGGGGGGSAGEPLPVSGGSGNLGYRRVSFTARQGPNGAGGRTSSAGPVLMSAPLMMGRVAPSMPSMPFLMHPPPPAAAPPPAPIASVLTPAAAGAGPQPPPATAGRPQPDTAVAPPEVPPPVASRVPLAKAGVPARIARSQAALAEAAPPAAAAARGPAGGSVRRATAATNGPVTVLSVREAQLPLQFSQGETSLSRLFYAVKKTGALPPPADGEEAAGQRAVNGDQAGSPPSSSSNGPSVESCLRARPHSADRQPLGQEAGTVGGTAPGAPAAEQAERGGAKRRRSMQRTRV
ncbi:Glutamyl-tRNA(Gln) amidotransferase subunit C [Chlorella vulgaris]